jgi:hypothetical protein
MPSLASRGIRFACPSSAATPNSAAVAHPKDAQKVTPWKNDLAETKPHIGIIARHGVSPWRGQSGPCFCLTRRARPSGPSKARSAGTGHSHLALTEGSGNVPRQLHGNDTRPRRGAGANHEQLGIGFPRAGAGAAM